MEQQFLFEVNDLAVKYPNGELALYNVNFSIESPTFMAIVGPNGSGKSTLLKTSLGLIKPVRGQVKVLGYDSVRESKKIRKLVRYVPQRDRIGLSVPLKVKDIVLMSRLLKKPPPRFAPSPASFLLDSYPNTPCRKQELQGNVGKHEGKQQP